LQLRFSSSKLYFLSSVNNDAKPRVAFSQFRPFLSG